VLERGTYSAKGWAAAQSGEAVTRNKRTPGNRSPVYVLPVGAEGTPNTASLSPVGRRAARSPQSAKSTLVRAPGHTQSGARHKRHPHKGEGVSPRRSARAYSRATRGTHSCEALVVPTSGPSGWFHLHVDASADMPATASRLGGGAPVCHAATTCQTDTTCKTQPLADTHRAAKQSRASTPQQTKQLAAAGVRERPSVPRPPPLSS